MIGGWLVKVALVIALLAVPSIDAASIAVEHIQIGDSSTEEVSAAQSAWHGTQNLQAAYDAALKVAEQNGDELPAKKFTVDASGNIHLTAVHTAKTLVTHDIGPLRHLTVVTATAVGNNALAGN